MSIGYISLRHTFETEIVWSDFADSKMDRISEIKCHPTAKDLLLSVSEDHGSPTVRVWDVISRSIVAQVVLPSGAVRIFPALNS